MPTERTIDYVFGGSTTQDYYTQKEMAESLSMTVADLRSALDEDAFGPCSLWLDRPALCYHLHPKATNKGEFLFNRSAYQTNLQMNNIVHWLRSLGKWQRNVEASYAWLAATGVERFVDSTNEQSLLTELDAFVTAWERKDVNHHRVIRGHVEHLPVLRKIWNNAGFLKDMNCTQNDDGVRFFGIDEPREGTFIPWRWLRVNHALGFYDQRKFPTQRQEFLPTIETNQWIPYEEQALKPGDMVVVENWVYDDCYEFCGMVIEVKPDEFEITENGRWLLEFDGDDQIMFYHPKVGD